MRKLFIIELDTTTYNENHLFIWDAVGGEAVLGALTKTPLVAMILDEGITDTIIKEVKQGVKANQQKLRADKQSKKAVA